MRTVRDILSIKGAIVHTILETASVLDAVKTMNDRRIGCLVVTRDDGSVSGVIAERDVLRRIAVAVEDLAQVPVRDVMTKKVVVCTASDKIDTLRSLMKTQWLRQVPVVDDGGRLEGIVSIGDVNAYMSKEEELEIKFLHDYIEGQVR